MTPAAGEGDPGLEPVEITIWTFEPTVADRFDTIVSGAERDRANGFAGAARALEFLAGRALARAALSRVTGIAAADIPIHVDEAGQPAVAATVAGAPRFSIAHCRGLVACALAPVPVGVDAERADRIPDAVAFSRRHFRPGEASRIGRAAAPAVAAVRLWSLKEAFSKAVGLGLRLPLDATDFDRFDTEKPTILAVPGAFGAAASWRCAIADRGGDIVLAVVVRTEGRPVSVRLRAARGTLIDPPPG
jgi:4'-phosphopantetheinyl transferase